MAQKRIEEKLEAVDQDTSSIRVELHKLSTIEENLASMAKSIERLGIQAEKQHQQQLLLKCIEGIMKEKSTMIEGPEGSSSKGSRIASMMDGGNPSIQEIKTATKTCQMQLG
uniref:Uncharacterized protein n=1 Tax=Cucumis melo TaxID=3656 RepID=A0A9I9D519_CUCME